MLVQKNVFLCGRDGNDACDEGRCETTRDGAGRGLLQLTFGMAHLVMVIDTAIFLR